MEVDRKRLATDFVDGLARSESRRFFAFLMALFLLDAMPVAAQSAGTFLPGVTLSAVSGLISGTKGAPISGARITLSRPDGGDQHTTRSDQNGRYRISGLATGNWVLLVEATGYLPFQAALPDRKSGQSLIQNPVLTLLKDAPLQGDGSLISLRPFRFDWGNAGQRGYRFAGRTLGSFVLTYDGADASPVINPGQQSFARYAIPFGSYYDQRIVAALFRADSVAGPGGARTLTSRQGSQSWHGDLTFNPRDNFFSARSPFSSNGLADSTLRYGVILAGPVPHTRTVFFLDYSGIRQSLEQSLIGYVPTANLTHQIEAREPKLKAVLAAYPAGNKLLEDSSGIALFQSTGSQNDDEDGGSLRLDRDFGARGGTGAINSTFLRINFDAARLNQPLGAGGSYLTDRLQRSAHPESLVVGWDHHFAGNLTGDLRLAAQRATLNSSSVGSLKIPYSVAVSGFTTLAGSQTTMSASNQYSASASIAWVRGAHNLTFGMELRRYQLNQGNSNVGSIAYSSLSSFSSNQVSTATFASALPVNGLRETQEYAWIQDNWRLRPRLLLGLGVRYSVYQPMNEVHGWAIPFDFGSCGSQGFCPAGASFSRLNLANIDPRVSVSWGPSFLPGWFASHTLLRMGGGIYHFPGLLADQNLPIQNEVKNYSLSADVTPSLSFPITPFLADSTGVASAYGMNRHRADPYAAEWALSAQEQLPEGFQVTATWFASLGQNLTNNTSLNLIDPGTLQRPYPAFSQIAFRSDEAQSAYNALSVLLEHTVSRSLLLMNTYTWSHAIDNDSSGGGEADRPQNPACLACERSSGDADQRQQLGAYSVYQLPWGSQRIFKISPRWLGAVAGNWDFQSSAVARTGLPVNVTIDRSSTSVATGYTLSQRPDRVPGVALTPPHGSTRSEWLNPAAFTSVHGLYGTTPRNVARGPSQWQIDTGLQREFFLPRKLRLDTRVLVENVLNHGQYGQPLSDWSTPQFGEVIAPATYSRTGVGAPRNVDFSLDIHY